MTPDHIARAIFQAATWRAFHAIPPLFALVIGGLLAIWFVAHASRR